MTEGQCRPSDNTNTTRDCLCDAFHQETTRAREPSGMKVMFQQRQCF